MGSSAGLLHLPGVPLLSVVIPIHEADAYLAEFETSLSSWIPYGSQTVQIILCDDGSSPTAIAASLRLTEHSSFTSLRIVSVGEQAGPGVARNAGLKVAEGLAIYFADSDDLPEPCTVLRAAELLAGDGSDIVQFAYSLRPWGEESPESQRLVVPAPTETLASCLLRSAAVWRFVFRRSFLEGSAVSFPPLRYAEDLIFLLALGEHAPRIATINDTGYHHRVGRVGSASTGVAPPDHRAAISELLGLRSRAQLPETRRLVEIWIGRMLILVGHLDSPLRARVTTFRQDCQQVGWRAVTWIGRAAARTICDRKAHGVRKSVQHDEQVLGDST